MNVDVGQAALIRGSRLLLSAFACVAMMALLSACAHMPVVGRDAGAAGPATVTGQIQSDRGAVIADAAVKLSGASVRRTVRTDIAGRYTFERVPLGRFVVSASAAGYKSAKQTVTVDKEGSVRADFKLRM